MATVNAKTTRASMSSGKRGGSGSDNLTGLKIVPLAPVNPELARRLEIDTPYETQVTFWDGSGGNDDVREGDKLVLTDSGDTYDVAAVGTWAWDDNFVQVFLEETKS